MDWKKIETKKVKVVLSDKNSQGHNYIYTGHVIVYNEGFLSLLDAVTEEQFSINVKDIQSIRVIE